MQSVYKCRGFIGVIIELSQVFLAIYDTDISPFTYTGSDNNDITYNQIPLIFPMEVNDEIVLNPRAYDGAVFEMLSGTDSFAFRQNSAHGGQPIAQFYSSTKHVYSMGIAKFQIHIISHLLVIYIYI